MSKIQPGGRSQPPGSYASWIRQLRDLPALIPHSVTVQLGVLGVLPIFAFYSSFSLSSPKYKPIQTLLKAAVNV